MNSQINDRVQILPGTLVELGVVSQETLDKVISWSKESGVDPIQAMYRKELISIEDIYRAVAKESGLPYVGIENINPTKDVLDRVPFEVAREYSVVPLAIQNDRLVIATTNPRAYRNALADALDYSLDYVVASKITLETKVAEYYSHSAQAGAMALSDRLDMSTTQELESLIVATGGDSDGSQKVTRNVVLVILEGVRRGASDIHIEPYGNVTRVRYRVDGQLRTATDISYSAADALLVVSRIKVAAGLDVNEKRRPQDGRISFRHDDKKIDLRVACVPMHSAGGPEREKIVMRILSSDLAGQPLDKLDFTAHNLNLMRSALRRNTGMVLVTGPTGSGKSTTLYAGIGETATDEVNVMTIEDPVEFNFNGINQVQARPDIGLDFATALRSFLRADPDVILVGEIRDLETAQIALKASLTGHLVLSTLHTNSAALTVSRLIEMGLEPYNLADALTAVLSQRLVQRLCRHCRIEDDPTPAQVSAVIGVNVTEVPRVYRANHHGCRRCTKGYSGRIPLHEMLPVTSAIKEAIRERQPAAQIERIAAEEGMMKTLMQDGWVKIVAGETDLEQVSMLSASDDLFTSGGLGPTPAALPAAPSSAAPAAPSHQLPRRESTPQPTQA